MPPGEAARLFILLFYHLFVIILILLIISNFRSRFAPPRPPLQRPLCSIKRPFRSITTPSLHHDLTSSLYLSNDRFAPDIRPSADSSSRLDSRELADPSFPPTRHCSTCTLAWNRVCVKCEAWAGQPSPSNATRTRRSTSLLLG
jgi:hypothetical protein